MSRLGKFTGHIYDDNYDFSNCSECCTIIPRDIEKDEEQLEKFISERRVKDLLSCMSCFGCPAAKFSKI